MEKNNRILIKPTTIADVVKIEIPKVQDTRGNLSVIEGRLIPFEIKRVYYLYDVPSGATRGGHAHIQLQQFIMVLSGSFDIVLKDGANECKINLNKPNEGILIPPGIWRELENFSSGSVCLVIASEVFEETDYIRQYEDFLSFKNTIT
ncbi:Sugar 3,4-ketoisomerase QdtA cupin domain-containing protein [Flavobacterium branchiophilum]|uniref:Sugar 3,4-ketoisomerase QdtA cupin domain-containing protein n=2 Tax=Flavobacterium branchiophilum TaxID=55197 RepID=G2Z6Z7_FLABF|nr:FdtA/QdtA family cupin domain-containing protein [Flavobacterium branchiophilum]PDS25243.1 WxcM-like domain-containing protein [Flavobacterium branchiophilum]CCB68999.1 Protein of unknown function [Flavobacterium branchiophilum FL-15]